MSIEFFKPGDAEFEFTQGGRGGFFDQISGSFIKNKIYEYRAKVISIDSANSLLHERGTVVRGKPKEGWTNQPSIYDTHQALLINIHPLKPESESEERKLLREIVDDMNGLIKAGWAPVTLIPKIEHAKKLLGDA